MDVSNDDILFATGTESEINIWCVFITYFIILFYYLNNRDLR